MKKQKKGHVSLARLNVQSLRHCPSAAEELAYIHCRPKAESEASSTLPVGPGSEEVFCFAARVELGGLG